MDEKKLYNRMDDENDMSDAEMRETYDAEISNQEDYDRWCDDNKG